MKKLSAAVVVCLALVGLALPAMGISGKVVQKNGKPVPNARVEILVGGRDLRVVTTNPKGAFSYVPSDGKDASCSFTVIASDQAYMCSRERHTVLQKRPVTLVVWPEGKLTGKVVDENGRPVAGARVALVEVRGASTARPYSFSITGRKWNQNWCWTRGIAQESVTDKHGVFTLTHFPRLDMLDTCRGRIEATANGLALVSRTFTEKDLRGKLTIKLPRECKLMGTVSLPDGSGTVSGGVRLALVAAGSSAGRAAVVGSDGIYSFAKLPPGKFKLVLAGVFPRDFATGRPTGASDDWTLDAVPVDLSPGQTQKVDLRLSERAD